MELGNADAGVEGDGNRLAVVIQGECSESLRLNAHEAERFVAAMRKASATGLMT